MAGAGSAVGPAAGGILTTDAWWRWCCFVNVPIGIVVVAVAPRVPAESHPGPAGSTWPARSPAPAVSRCGLRPVEAATGSDGVSHWGDTQVLVSLTMFVVLLGAFVLIEMRSARPLLPMRDSPTATGRVPT